MSKSKTTTDPRCVRMTANQKRLVCEQLCPRILADEGNGFAMENWSEPIESPELIEGVLYEVPKCGTVCCIGGTLESIVGKIISEYELGEMIGLDAQQTEALFYCWSHIPTARFPLTWASRYRLAYERNCTPLGRARVAACLLTDMCAGKRVFDMWEGT